MIWFTHPAPKVAVRLTEASPLSGSTTAAIFILLDDEHLQKFLATGGKDELIP
jgi:hypothetical protein